MFGNLEKLAWHDVFMTASSEDGYFSKHEDLDSLKLACLTENSLVAFAKALRLNLPSLKV